MPRPAKPWFRYYSEALESRKVQSLPPALFKHWVNLLSLANVGKPRGHLPTLEDIAFALRLKAPATQAVIDDLIERRFLDLKPDGLWAHDWPDWQKDRDVNPEQRDIGHANVTDSARKRDVSVTRGEERRSDSLEEDSLEEELEEEEEEIVRRLRDDWRQPIGSGVKAEISKAATQR